MSVLDSFKYWGCSGYTMAFLILVKNFKNPSVNEPFKKLCTFVCIFLFWGHFNLFTGLDQIYSDNGHNQHRNIQKLFCAMNSIIEETLHMNKEYIYHVHTVVHLQIYFITIYRYS